MATVAVVTYSCLILVWFLCLIFLRDRWWPLIMVNFLSADLLGLALPAFLAAVAIWNRRLLMLASVPLLIYGYLFGAFLVPDFGPGPAIAPDASGQLSPARSDSPSTVRIMTYNVLNNNDDIEAVADVVDRYGPDLISVQELTPEHAPLLIAELADSHPHVVVAAETRGGTTALFSATPFLAVNEIDFGIDRPALIATTIVGGHEIVVASAHLNPSFYALNYTSWRQKPGAINQYMRDQNSQATQLVEALEAAGRNTGAPVFLGCDCNTREVNRSNEILSSYLTDPAKELGRPIGQPSLAGTEHERRVTHVDYLWYRPGLDTSVAVDGIYRIVDRGGSDHFPLVADFTI